MKIAEISSEQSTCLKKSVGAALVCAGRIVSTGYNGAPSETPHCKKNTCWRMGSRDNKNPQLCRGVHAEINCIIQCAIHGIEIKQPSTIFCTHFPCMSCAKMIINAKIDNIVFHNEYEMDNIHKMKLLKESSVKIYKATKYFDTKILTEKFKLESFDVDAQIKIIEEQNNIR